MAEKNYEVLSDDIEQAYAGLTSNEYHVMEDMNYKEERRRDTNCKIILQDYYQKNYETYGQECVDKFMEYLHEMEKSKYGYGHNIYSGNVKEWFGDIEAGKFVQKVETEEQSLRRNPKEKNPDTRNKVFLKIPPNLSREERKEVEDALFKAGARYTKEVIPAERSRNGKEVTYKSWYVMQSENTDMTPFEEYIRPDRVLEKQKDLNKASIDTPEEHTDTNSDKTPGHNQDSQSRHDEKRIYLNIPHVPALAFRIITENLKRDGAKFDGVAKAWYITTDNDFNKFKDYLGLSKDQVMNKRESVLTKLNENKRTIENNEKSGNEIIREPKQRESLEK